MTDKEILAAARALIEDPEHWTRYAAARDSSGTPCISTSPHAVKFCSVGAIERACYNSVGSNGPYFRLTGIIIKKVDNIIGRHLYTVNDLSTTTHEDTLKTFDSLIEEIE